MASNYMTWTGRKPLVGILGSSPPIEVILAAGAEPLFIRPDAHGALDVAARYLDDYIDAGVRNVLDRAVRGEFEAMDLLVCEGQDDRLYHFMKEVVRLGEGARMPPLFMYDLLQSGLPADANYNLTQLRNLVDRLEATTGARAEGEVLVKAIEASNRGRAIKRKLNEKRIDARPYISGAEASSLLRQARGLAPDAYGPVLEAAIAKLPPKPLPGARIMLIPSAELQDDAVHRLFEDAGAVVTVEDDLSGSRGVLPDIATSGDPLAAIGARLYDDIPGPQVFPQERRFGWTFAQMAGPNIDGVAFYIPPSDRDFGWSYPRLRAAAETFGKPGSFSARTPTTPRACRP